MTENSSNENIGAWIVHHGRKISLDVKAPAEFPTIDEAGKAAELLIRLAETNQTTLTMSEVRAVAYDIGLNPRSQLPHFLDLLQRRRLIDQSDSEISVLGVTGRGALRHAHAIWRDAEPDPAEKAVLDLGELTSDSPKRIGDASQYVSDTYKLPTADATDLLERSVQVGFVDAEGNKDDRVLFNGNLFKRDIIDKTNRVLNSLSDEEERLFREIQEQLGANGCLDAQRVEKVLGQDLFEKLRAAGLLEVNLVSNEKGDHAFVNSPGAFHKFVSPLVDDSFDLAKALVSAITYGMTQRKTTEGRIISADWILSALVNGRTIGPAPAIGRDYRILERNRVVKIIQGSGGQFRMKLLKKDIGELAQAVLRRGDANVETLRSPPSSPMTGFKGPEEMRTQTRRAQREMSKRATRDVIETLRGRRKL